MSIVNKFVIPNYVSAGSPKRLRRLMFAVNAKHGGQAKFRDIQWVESEKKWYAWYFAEVKPGDELRRLDGASEE